MSIELDKIKAKIEKLLALATSPNEHEANAAMIKANELMQQHAIEMSHLQGGTDILTETFDLERRAYPQWMGSLYRAVSKSSGVYTVYGNRSAGRAKPTTLLFMTGRKTDIENTRYIAEVLIKQVENMTKKYAKTAESWMDAGQRRSRANSYRVGLARGLEVRLEEITKAFFDKELATNKSLTVVDTHTAKLDAATELYLQDNKVRSVSTQTRHNSSALNAGYRDSDNLSVNHGVEGVTTPTAQISR